MKGTKLINLLKTLTPEEIISFEKFISSPYFNSVKIHKNLFNELKKFYPDFNDSKLTKEYIYKKIYKNRAFNKQIMSNLSSGFEKLAREFLIQTALAKIKPIKNKLIFNELENRFLDRHFVKELDEMEKMIDENKIDDDYFYYFMILEEARISYWQKVKGLQNAFAGNVYKAAELSTLDYLTGIYRKIANIEFFKNMYNLEDKDSIFPDVVKNINFRKISEECVKFSSKNAELTEFFCSIILCIVEPENDENLFKARDFLFKNHGIFDTNELRSLVSVLESYCIYKSRQGDANYKMHLFEINEFRLKQGIMLYDSGKFSKTLYIQMVINGLDLGKTEWVTNFIREYTPMLVDEQQLPMRALADSFMYYKLKKYDKVLKSLNNVVFIDSRDKVHVKNLTAKTYYDMGEYDTLLSHIDSSKHFQKNNKNLSPFYKETLGNFYLYLHKLVIAREKDDKGILKSLLNSISSEKSLIHKNWLIEKVKELQ